MKPSYILLYLLIFLQTTLQAQNSTADTAITETLKQEKPNHMDFRKFRLDVAGIVGIRFAGKKEEGVKHSKTGYGGFIQPAINLTDQHAIGLKMVWTYHEENDKINHWSLLANYMFTWYEETGIYNMEKFVTFYGGAGAGISNGPGENSDPAAGYYPNKTSFALMPYAGIRYGWFFIDGDYHFAFGNKLNSFLSCSVGIVFNGGFKKSRNT